MFKKTLTVSMVLLLCMVIAPQQVEAVGITFTPDPGFQINKDQLLSVFVFCIKCGNIFAFGWICNHIYKMKQKKVTNK